MLKPIFISFVFWTFTFAGSIAEAQNIFEYEKGKKKIDIPFTMENNFILVKIRLNNFIPLTFIFDTGAEYTILAKREFTDLLGINYDREFKLIGADLSTEIIAHLAKNIDIALPGVRAKSQNILVLDKDYFHFEEYAGVSIDGVLGADIFRHFVVKINYKRGVISLYEPSKFKKPKGYEEFRIDIKSSKPYLRLPVYIRDSLILSSKFLIDSGAGLSLLLYTNTHDEFELPPNVITGNIGFGLGGFMEGYLGRIHKLSLPPFQFTNVVTNFQELNTDFDVNQIVLRDGIIGNGLLSRFFVIIDYHSSRLYLKPRKKYNRGFEYDRSGLVLIASGPELDKFEVISVLPGSPAAEAGLLPRDVVRGINRLPNSFLSLNLITRKLQGRAGKKIRLVIKRNEEKRVITFILKDLI